MMIKKEKRFRTISTESTSNAKLDFVLKRACEERLLPELISQTLHTSSTFQNQINSSNRDFRMHSQSLQKPIKFSKEDFIDPKEKFQRNLKQFLSGTRSIDYFENKIVDAYSFKPEIIFENCEEQQNVSPFKELQITNKRQVVFDQKLDDVFIGHKVQEVQSALIIKSDNNQVSNQQLSKRDRINQTKKKNNFNDMDNINITQHLQDSTKTLPLIQQKNLTNHMIINPSQDKILNLSIKESSNFFIPIRKVNRRNNNNLLNLSCTTVAQMEYNPYQPETEFSNPYNFIKANKKNIDTVKDQIGNIQKNHINSQRFQVQLEGGNKQYSVQQQHLLNSDLKQNISTVKSANKETTVSSSIRQSLIESFRQLQRDKKLVSLENNKICKPNHYQQNNNLQEVNRPIKLQKNKQNNGLVRSTAQYSLNKDNKYLIDNFSSVHNPDKIRQNPMQEYMIRQKQSKEHRFSLGGVD